ncbi:acyl-CoA dehydrogenase family protein [Haloechinothrix sp. LS1_15]|uniref:acyl-CoA dehydrogenase family protein n=1 Tax=Haloechinothrix sp. LS1_15 TaxID=2652248 RepID=UPI002946777C|nr:acyl-CoA dehydrogenase family protein [Haloechinothrix sp. LS1_15]MDV6014141.1 acyl-CoA dehydrogenase [Haloechinothrix sp. LS1_15]
MDFSLTEAQRDLAGLAGRILGDWAERDGDQRTEPFDDPFDATLWEQLAQAGLLDAALPESVGGGGFGLLEQCSVLIELGRVAAPVPYLPSITGAASAIAEFGTGLHAERWALPVTRGQRTMAIALADEGDDPGFTARRAGGSWRVSGTQTAVLHGAHADAFACEVATDEGDALMLVDRGHSGLRVTGQHAVDGTGAALVELDEAEATDDALLGEPGSGAARWLRLRATVGLCALQLGIVSRALEMTGEYARKREQFGEVIGSFQAVRQRLAEAYLDVEAVRLTLWQAAWRLSEGLPADEEVATAKFWAAQAGHRVAHTAVHIHGGVGIDMDYPLHRYFVAAKRTEFALGGATAQLRALGTHLAEAPA